MKVSMLLIEARTDDGADYGGHRVFFDGKQAYWRPYDGSDSDEVEYEAAAALGELVREKLGYPARPKTDEQEEQNV